MAVYCPPIEIIPQDWNLMGNYLSGPGNKWLNQALPLESQVLAGITSSGWLDSRGSALAKRSVGEELPVADTALSGKILAE